MSSRALLPASVLSVSALSCALALVAAPGCGSSSSDAHADDAGAETSSDALVPDAPDAPDAPIGCVRTPAAADRPRKVVASHPYDAAAAKAKVFEVLDLSATGALSRPATPVTFSMGTALSSPIAFTSDGAVGLVAQDDGSIGVFRLEATGPVVVHAALKGDFYADRVYLSADGARAFVVDSNTIENGGGVYEFAVACDGALTLRAHVIAGSGAHAMALFANDPTKAMVAVSKVAGAAAGDDVHVFDLGSWTRISSGVAFADGEAIPSDLALTPDGRFAFLADDGILVGSRVALLSLSAGGAGITQVGTLDTPYPDAIAVSPWGNAAIVLNDDSTDQIHILKPGGDAGAPWSITGELAYKFGKPQLPTTVSTIDRGALSGTVFLGENVAVRQVRFTAAGDVVDTAKLSFGSGYEAIVGVVGVQP